MTIAHHPSQETLLAFTNGTLSEGNSLVLATHLAHCAECRQTVRDLSEMGGRVLEDAGSAPLSKTSRQSVLSRLDQDPDAAKPLVELHEAPIQGLASDSQILRPLSLYTGGSWDWVGPGVRRRFIDIPNDPATRVFMLRAEPGTRLPDHRHHGTEWTLVLKGAYRHDHGRFGAGDFDEADDSVDHNPEVEDGEECICLVALSGNVEMTGWLGRVIQPFVRL